MVDLLIYGIKDAWNSKRIVWFAYALQIFFGIIVAILFTDLLKSSIFHSINFGSLLGGYDHTVISDFRNNHPEIINRIMNLISWMTLMFIPVSVYINGVLLHALIIKPPSIKHSMISGFKTYLSFFVVMLITVVSLVLWAVVTLGPLVNLVQKVFEATLSQPGLLAYYLLGGVAFYIGVVFILNWSITTRALYLRTSRPVGICMRVAFKEVFTKPLLTFGMTTLFILLQAILIGFYLWLENLSGMINTGMIIMFFVVQQLFVLVRILWRLILYSGIDQIHVQSYLTRVTSPR